MQIYHSKRDLENEIKSDQDIKIINVSYENLILNYNSHLKEIEKFYKLKTGKKLMKVN